MSPPETGDIPPPIDDPGAVVEWFLRKDEGVADHMTFAARLAPSVFWDTRSEILNDLQQFEGVEALTGQMASVNRQWGEIVTRAKKLIDTHGGPDSVPEAEQPELGRLAVSQAILATRVRVLGHFLQEMTGGEPPGAPTTDDEGGTT